MRGYMTLSHFCYWNWEGGQGSSRQEQLMFDDEMRNGSCE